MGKKKLATIVVAVVAVCASYNVYQSQNTNTLSDLALANVEALASSRESSGTPCKMTSDWKCTFWATGSYCYCGLG